MAVKKSLRALVLLQGAAVFAVSVQAANAGNLSVNINLGEPPRTVVVAPPPPAYAPAPVYVAPPPPMYVPPAEVIRVDEDLQFIYPSNLGFYVAVGVPYDLFFLNNSYYLYRDGRWLHARSSRGPWMVQSYRELPPGLRRHRLERIREYRNREYVVYQRDRDHYRGKHFRSDKEQWKEQRHEAKEQRKEERHFEKEARKDEKRYEKEQRKEEKRHDKEERRDDRREERRDR